MQNRFVAEEGIILSFVWGGQFTNNLDAASTVMHARYYLHEGEINGDVAERYSEGCEGGPAAVKATWKSPWSH